jgi:glycosyltransferase involved in cell wall biosynthesis
LTTNEDPLRIAVLSPISWTTPPRHYGPWELFASLLTEGLVARGHVVTLFATADSSTTGRLVATSPTGWSEDASIEPKVAECLHIAAVFERASEFDIIQNGFDFLPLTYSELVDVPMVTTIHGFSSEAIVPVYERYNASNYYVAISDANRHSKLDYAATIHHGINVDDFAFCAVPDTYLLFFGRIHPHKGTAEAIAVARRAGRPLIIAGIVQDQDYFRQEVEPHLDGTNVKFVGAVGGASRAQLLGGAAALLHLISFDEPFGFSVVEAMACGTPTIAFDRGSMNELLDHESGVTTTTLEGAIDAVEKAVHLDRRAVRLSAERRFRSTRMVEKYEALYREILAQTTESRKSASAPPKAVWPDSR